MDIFNLNVQVNNYPFEELEEYLRPFVKKNVNSDVDFIYNFHIIDNYEAKADTGIQLFANNVREVYRSNDTYMIVCRNEFTNKPPMKGYTVFSTHSKVIDVWVSSSYFTLPRCQMLVDALFAWEYVIIPHKRIVMHAAVVEYHGSSILFTGPSGIGKSTQSNMWADYKGADIINGDRGVIDVSGTEVIVHGAPFAGSSNIYRNVHSPVHAVIKLNQSEENTIERLYGKELLRHMYPRFMYAGWDELFFNMSFDVIQQFLSKVPVYHLSCVPDISAVKLAFETIFKKS